MTLGHLIACDGCFVGFPAILSLVIAVVVLIGSIYMLLWSNLGARQAYLVMMVALMGWMILLSAMWLFGAPGTTPGTGPRGREPAWVPFTPTSDQGKVFADAIATFPNKWDQPGKGGDGAGIYPGKIDSHGELITVSAAIEDALARLAGKQKTDAITPADWTFRSSDDPPLPGQEHVPAATTRYFQNGDSQLLFGVSIPAVDESLAATLGTHPHPAVTVFAYRDKGLVYLYALYFLLASVLLFVVHLVMLVRYERKSIEDDARLAPEPALT